MSQAGVDIKRKRIPEIDFWRGFALIVILIDHVPGNGLDHFIPQNFGFSDAAEVFVFLSGVSVSLAYAPTLQKAGFGGLVKRCASRAAKIYLVHIAVVACSVAIPLAAAKVVGDEGRSAGTGTIPVPQLSNSSLFSAAALAYMPVFFRRPGALCRLDALGALVIFSGVAQSCLGASCVHRSLRGRARPRQGGRRRLVLQSLRLAACVCIGIICALRWRNGLPRPQGRLVVLALAVILGAAILSIRAMGLRAAVFAHLDLDKHDLGIMRLAHFLALAYVMSSVAVVEPWATRTSRIVGTRVGQSFQGMGRNSLLFFALGSVASAGGRSLMAAAHSMGGHLSVHLIGLVYTAAAVIGMFAVANRMRRTGRSPGLSNENGIAPAVRMNSPGPAAEEDAAVPY